jgi:hypothetical protein
MLEKKQLYLANFNCTFGENDEPMLERLIDVIVPAFQQELGRKSGENKFRFMNVKVVLVQGDFGLAGQIIKQTKLEVKSRIADGKLVKTDDVYPSDPYSYFLINLKNHRMTLVKNQKGSPDLGNFSATAQFLLEQYVRKYNRNIIKKEDTLPKPHLHVVAIPFEGAIKDELRKVSKINNVTLRFYPLNGDEDTKAAFKHLREILHETGSKSGNTQINTPNNYEEVAELLDDTKGLVSPSIKVQYPNKTSRTLKDDSLTEKMEIELDDEEGLRENIEKISRKVVNREEYKVTSEENKKLYEKWYTKILEIYNNLL